MKVVKCDIENNKLNILSVVFNRREVLEIRWLIEYSDSEFLDDLYDEALEGPKSLSYKFDSNSLRALIDVIETVDTDIESLYTLTTYSKYV